MQTPDRSPQQEREQAAQPASEQWADTDAPLPDVPDAGDDSEPLVPATPPNITNEMLTVDGAIAAGTLDDDDDRTLYERTLDAQAEHDQNAGDRPA